MYAGIDWATQKHDICALDMNGTPVAKSQFPNTGEGLAELSEWLLANAPVGAREPDRVWVAIEVPHGPVVETLLERGFRVYSINPKQLDRFRDRFTVAGAKDDSRDARVLADSLRTDGRAFRHLEADNPLIIEIRGASRMMGDLTEERSRLSNQLREQLMRYFPQALDLAQPAEPWFLELVERVPTPAAARRRCKPAITSILKRHRIRRVNTAQVVEILRSEPLTVAPGTVESATRAIALLSQRLKLVNHQLRECERELDQLIGKLSLEGEAGEAEGQACGQRDIEILRSFPGIGQIGLATLLAEASRPLRERDYHAMRTLAGIAPVTKRSGKRTLVLRRLACSDRLSRAMYHWARVASQRDPHWKERYRRMRARGLSHGRACRGVADCMLRSLMAMLRTQTTYDPTRFGSTIGGRAA